MKYKRILVLLTIVLLSASVAIVTKATSTNAASFKDQSGISNQKYSNEVFLDPYLREASSTKSTEGLESLIVMFNPTVDRGLRTQLLSSIERVEVTQAYKILPGVAINAPLCAIEVIKKLEGVEAIWLDHEVEALSDSNQVGLRHQVSPMLSGSTGLVNAPSLWALGINGSGIVIAVVDTGINWNHESLDDLDDNPATNDPKVIANVSFVPGVPTGFDDHGHGTHVAGIAAGTGGPSHVYMGVAPGAQLYAVKVLTGGGGGMWSWVIAGIEWSVEHDADVITMSLGGSGYPYAPVSMASNVAVDAGIVVTVAAGNGYGYRTVISPGLATKVITVGASTKSDTIAIFSSGGPNNFDSRGDPDVVAPGVGIMSADAWDITGYISMSGTSMATPHVAGGAALLLQAFAGATPELVGSALMASAVDLGFDSYLQGAGRIDVLGAYNLIAESVSQGIIILGTTPQPSRSPSQGEISPQYAFFSNSRLQLFVGDRGYIFVTYFDGQSQWAYMDWRIAYNTSNLASWQLEVLQPVTMMVQNATYQQARGILLTPERAAVIVVMIELFGEATWARTSFTVLPVGVTLENLRIFYIEDAEMYFGDENDWSYYYSSQDITVVNDTLEAIPAQHFGFGGGLPSSAHHVGEYPSAFVAAYYDNLNNMTEWVGDDHNAFRWSLGNVSTQTTVPVIFGLEYNVSAIFGVINAGRAIPVTPFELWPDLSPRVSGPTLATPDTDTTYNVTVYNYGFADSVGATLNVYVDGILQQTTIVNVSVGGSVEVPVIVSMSMGLHYVEAEVIDVNDPLTQNNFARKKVFVGIMFSALLPYELEVNTYTDFGPFSWYSYAWVNLTIITPILMPDVEIRLTGNVSQVVSFVDSPSVGDIEGWGYFAFEVYASGAPNSVYTGFIQIISAGVVMNKLPVTVNVRWNPAPKINSVSLNDTLVLRVTETLGVTVNVTDINSLGNSTDLSLLTVDVYLLYYDTELFGWYIMETLPAQYNDTTGLFEFNYTFPASMPIDQLYGINVEAVDPNGYEVLAMPRPFYVANNVPVVSTALFPRNIAGNKTVSINVTTSDIETITKDLKLTGFVKTPTGREVPVQLTLVGDVFTAAFNDTSEEGVYIFVVLVTDSDGGSMVSTALFEVDNTAPKVDILSPMDGTFVSGAINITFVAEDPRLNNASLVIDNNPPINVTGTKLFTLDTTTLTDGPHTIRLVAFDIVGNNAEASVSIIVDNTSPQANIISPINGSFLAGTANVTFSYSDTNLESATLLHDGKTLADVSGTIFYLWNTTQAADGEHILTLVIVDKVGNTATDEIGVTVDNTGPTAEIRDPLENAYVKGICKITVYGYDVNFDSMELYIDGTLVENWTLTSLKTYLWNTTALDDGSHTIKLKVYDKAGNFVETTVSVTVDNTLPTVNLTSPDKGAWLAGTATIKFTASDVNLDKALLYIDTIVIDTTGEISYQWDTTTVGDGSHTIKIVATDGAGNTNSTSITVIVDNTMPTLGIISPENGTAVAGSMAVSFFAFDVNLFNVTYSIDGGAFVDVTGEKNFTVDTITLIDGSHTIKLIIYDKAGNAIEEDVTMTVDNTLPSVSITSPTDGAELSGIVTIDFTASDTNLDKVLLYIDTAVIDVTGTTSYNWETTTVGDGSHTIRLVATDEAGNVEEIQITVTTTNVQKAKEEGYTSGRNFGIMIGAILGLVAGAIIATVITKKRSKKLPLPSFFL